MTRQPKTTQCPWCGRDSAVTGKGVLPRHKRVTGRDDHGAVTHGWCEGGGDMPHMLTPGEKHYLRMLWRDAGGEILAGGDT